MPASIKLQEEYGDDVQVIFVHCQAPPQDEWESFAWKMKWMGNGALWTEERPLSTVGEGLPEVALIGIDGTVLMQGYPGDFGKKLHEAVASEIKKAKDAPTGTPKELSKPWALFNKGDVAAALLECDKLATDAAKEAKTEFLLRATKKVERTKWLLDNGYIADAEKILSALDKASKLDADLGTKWGEQNARLATPEITREREASKAWGNLVEKIAKDKPFEPGNVKKAQTIVDKHSGTKAADRAARFVALSKVKVAM